MFHVTGDGSVLDGDGKIIFFSLQRFISDIANGDCCFICGAQRGAVPFNDEHVIPDWILRRFGLHSKQVQIPNRTGFRYGELKVPCCKTCNSAMGDFFEKPISAVFAGGVKALEQELKDSGPWALFMWMALIFLKTHLKDKYLNFHRDRRKGDMKIGELHSWEELHHLHCLIRSFYTKATVEKEVLGTLLVLPAKERQHFESYDFIDLSVAQTMLLRIGDVAVIAVINDSQAVMSAAFDDLKSKIGGPLSPVQLREITARFASINLQFQPRPRFFSEVDTATESYRILAERPERVEIPVWNRELYGKIMFALTEDMLHGLDNSEEIGNLVKSGRYTFLTTPEGSFDADSMELAPVPSVDPDTQ